MSWGTYYIHETYFHKETFDSLDEVNKKLDELNLVKTMLLDELKSLALMTEPKKMLSIDEDTDASHVVISRFNESINELLNIQIDLYKLNSLKNDWNECHTINSNGVEVAKNQPEGFEPPYLSGDFIRGDKENTDGESNS